MTLHHWDVKSDVPKDIVGIYDIVHIRNFAFVLQSDDIQRFLDNLIKMIRRLFLTTRAYNANDGLSDRTRR